MSAHYLLRFDDVCPTMAWAVWDKIEAILNRGNLRPILAVVPDNQDEHLKVNEANPEFWSRVREWQSRGWTIGLHGYQHRYVNDEAGIIGYNHYSEFAGLCETEQQTKIAAAVAVFREHQVIPEVWIAPAHSFDHTTLALLYLAGIRALSDGYFPVPGCDKEGMLWIPQQLWRLRWLPWGVWTVCFHPNSWRDEDLGGFEKSVDRYRNSITDFREVVDRFAEREQGLTDLLFSNVFSAVLRLKRL
jgi:hypothetical protein